MVQNYNFFHTLSNNLYFFLYYYDYDLNRSSCLQSPWDAFTSSAKLYGVKIREQTRYFLAILNNNFFF